MESFHNSHNLNDSSWASRPKHILNLSQRKLRHSSYIYGGTLGRFSYIYYKSCKISIENSHLFPPPVFRRYMYRTPRWDSFVRIESKNVAKSVEKQAI